MAGRLTIRLLIPTSSFELAVGLMYVETFITVSKSPKKRQKFCTSSAGFIAWRLPWCTTQNESEFAIVADNIHPIISLSGIPNAVACKKSADVKLGPGERQRTEIGRLGFSVCADKASVTSTKLVNVPISDGSRAQGALLHKSHSLRLKCRCIF